MKINKKTRKEKKESQLLKYWNKTRKTFTPKQLIALVREIEYLPLKKGAVETFLEAEGPIFNDYYEMFYATQDLFEQDEVLSEEFYKKFLDKRVSSVDQLMELTFEGNTKAAKELFRRIDAREINRDKSEQIFMTLFEKIPTPASRKIIYEKADKLGLDEKELGQMAEIAKRAFLYSIVNKIGKKMAWLKKRRSKEEKVLQKIRGLLQEIKQNKEQV